LLPGRRDIFDGSPHQATATIWPLDLKRVWSKRTSSSICIVNEDAPIGADRGDPTHCPTRAIMPTKTNTLSLTKADAS
jgi:hypothetical protein